MKRITIKLFEIKNIPCENCGTVENVYKIIEVNNFIEPKRTNGCLCKKCWLLASKVAYEELYGKGRVICKE